LQAAQCLAEKLRDPRSASQCGQFTRPEVIVCVFPTETTPMDEVLISKQANRSTAFHIPTVAMDTVRSMLQLLEAYNAEHKGKAQQLSPTTVTLTQLNNIAAGAEDINGVIQHRSFSSQQYLVFRFCMLFGPDVVPLASPAFKTRRKKAEQFESLEMSWLQALVLEVQDRTYMPTFQDLTELKQQHPHFHPLPSVAEFVIQRVVRCRDETANRKNSPSALAHDQPLHCSTAGDVPGVVKHASTCCFSS